MAWLGIAADIVDDSKQALARLHAAPHDLFITDCLMPKLDGYELARAIHEWERNHPRSRLPIIALSANAPSEDVQRCFDAGMDDFVAKQIDLTIFRTVLAWWLPSRPSGVPSSMHDAAQPPPVPALTQRIGSSAIALEITRTLAQALE